MNAFRASALCSALVAFTLSFTLNGCGLGGEDPTTADTTDTGNGTDVSEAPAGLSCWDLNGDGVFNPATEDIDRNGYATADDCRGQDGADGKSCTVAIDKAGAIVTCSDGSQVLVKNGTNGAAGLNGTSCTVVETAAGATVKCSDGTQAALSDGQDGADGTSCVSEPSGTYKGCVQVVCGELKSEPICDGKDGAQGEQGEPGTPGEPGEPGQDGTGASTCSSDSDCLNQQLCVDGDLVAVLHSYCWEGQCLPANLELGTFCDYGCSKGSCLPECNNSEDCAPGYACTEAGVCQFSQGLECTVAADCYVPPTCSGNVLGTPTFACQSGQCVSTGAGSTTCAHGCSNGACQPPPVTPNCDDGNACTLDTLTGSTCNHAAMSCVDGNVCTTDTCSSATGCTYTSNTVTCNDGNACTAGEACSGGVCRNGATVNCDDGNVNTVDSCEPGVGCKNLTVNVACKTLTTKSGWLIDGSVGQKGADGLPSGDWLEGNTSVTWCPGSGQVALINGHEFPNGPSKDWVVHNTKAPAACTSSADAVIQVDPATVFVGPLPASLGCVPYCDKYGNTNYLCQ